jgi:hypothetical protein
MVRRTHAGAKRLDPVREAGVAAIELRPAFDDVEGGLVQRSEPYSVGNRYSFTPASIAGERACEIRSGPSKDGRCP